MMAFTEVHMIYHAWIHPLYHSPPPLPIHGIVSTGIIFSFTYMCAQYLYLVPLSQLKYDHEHVFCWNSNLVAVTFESRFIRSYLTNSFPMWITVGSSSHRYLFLLGILPMCLLLQYPCCFCAVVENKSLWHMLLLSLESSPAWYIPTIVPWDFVTL
jgi:hypothetical protein